MNYRKQKFLLLVLLMGWSASAAIALSGLLMGYVPWLENKLVPEPDYTKAFVLELAGEYYRQVQTAVVVEETTISQVTRKPLVLSPEKDSARNFGASGTKLRVLKEPGVTKFVYNPKEQSLRITYMTYVADRHKAFSFPLSTKGAVLKLGQVEGKRVKFSSAVNIDLLPLSLGKLHWRSGETPDFNYFQQEFNRLVWFQSAVQFEFPRSGSLEKMRAHAASGIIQQRMLSRRQLLPFGLLGLVGFGILVWVWYRKYLRDFGLEPCPPGFLAAVWSDDLEVLTRKCLAVRSAQRTNSQRLSLVPNSQHQTAIASKPNDSFGVSFQDTGALEVPEQRQRRRVDALLLQYQEMSARAKNAQAQQLYDAAIVATSLRQKRNLLVQAIASLDDTAPEKLGVSVSVEEGETSTRQTQAPVVYLTIEQRLDEMFPPPDYLPAKVDGCIVRNVLIALIEPGRRMNIFGNKYKPEDALKREVVQRCRRFKVPFDPKVFWDALDWLVSQGVLIEGNKQDVSTYSLESDPGNGKSDAGKRLISTVKRVHDEFARK